jgi:hypothetical protein
MFSTSYSRPKPQVCSNSTIQARRNVPHI